MGKVSMPFFSAIYFLLFTLLPVMIARAQDLPENPEQKAETYFKNSIKLQSRLYNGPVYRGYGKKVLGSANFQDLDFTPGELLYDSESFSNVPLFYDLCQDRLVTRIGKENVLSLVNDKVAYFVINNHHFKYISVRDTSKSIIKPGFFDFIHDGKEKIIVKRTKILDFVSGNTSAEYYFLPKTSYYLQRGENYYPFNSKNSFLKLYADRKKELKQYIKQQKIKFKKQPEEAMIRIAQYYERFLH